MKKRSVQWRKLPWKTIFLEARDYVQLTMGALLIAVAIDAFLVPNQVVAGGITGIATLLHLNIRIQRIVHIFGVKADH